ncbi:MAG TPA: glycoside hydrolase family 43 protein [Verrucomicrobiae bacterium]|nr:glycoside hydrolase family 43 protein [Verrucomicrobiae bacterium]
MKTLKQTVVLCAAWLSLAVLQAAESGATNSAASQLPSASNLRLANIRVHDPFIVAHEPSKTYHLYTAIGRRSPVGRSGVVTYKSKDLLNWDGPHLVFTVPDGVWANPNDGVWAPEVHEYKGKFYLFCTLHNNAAVFSVPPESVRTNHLRGSVVAESDSPEGPFRLLKTSGPHPPTNFMTLDGTLFVDPEGQPWMVYAHEWIQVVDGTMEAIRLKEDLSDSIGEPIHLFKASDAPWINAEKVPSVRENRYVTDGPQFYRTKAGKLLMLWASYNRNGYVETLARSRTGTLKGPWEQLEPLVGNDSGHGMLFKTFDGQLMMVLHQPFGSPRTRAKLYEMEDTGDAVRVMRAREDLHGALQP